MWCCRTARHARGVEYIRFSSSSVVDKPSAGVAVRLTLGNGGETVQTARIVLGCVGATPVRARKAEGLIAGKQLTPELAEQAEASRRRNVVRPAICAARNNTSARSSRHW